MPSFTLNPSPVSQSELWTKPSWRAASFFFPQRPWKQRISTGLPRDYTDFFISNYSWVVKHTSPNSSSCTSGSGWIWVSMDSNTGTCLNKGKVDWRDTANLLHPNLSEIPNQSVGTPKRSLSLCLFDTVAVSQYMNRVNLPVKYDKR